MPDFFYGHAFLPGNVKSDNLAGNRYYSLENINVMCLLKLESCIR